MPASYTCFWICCIPFDHKTPMRVRTEKRAATRAALESAGFAPEYKFHFKSDMAKSLGMAAKTAAEKRAAEILAATGIEMTVTEGTYL